MPTEVFSQVVLPGKDPPANFAQVDHLEVAFAFSAGRRDEVEVDGLLVRELLAAVRAHAAESRFAFGDSQFVLFVSSNR